MQSDSATEPYDHPPHSQQPADRRVPEHRQQHRVPGQLWSRSRLLRGGTAGASPHARGFRGSRAGLARGQGVGDREVAEAAGDRAEDRGAGAELAAQRT